MSHYRRTNHYLTIDGETKLLTEWAEETGVSYQLIRDRLGRGWEPAKAVYLLPRKYARNQESNEPESTAYSG